MSKRNDIGFYLARNEVQELFAFGKILREQPDMNRGILHRYLKYLTQPSPHLLPAQLSWWISQHERYGQEVPQWLIDADLELMSMNKNN